MTGAADLRPLLAVQEADRSLDALRHQRATLPQRAQLEAIAEKRAALAATVETVQAERHEIERHQKRLEDEVALIEDRITREDGRMYDGSITAVKELAAIGDEIEGLRRRQMLVEDQVIEVMERAEPVDATLAEHQATSAALDAEEAAANEALAAAEAEVDAELAEVAAARDGHAEAVADDILADYERIRSVPGQIGVARLVGSTCHGCHLELAAVEVDRLKKLPVDQLVHCEECGCILVR